MYNSNNKWLLLYLLIIVCCGVRYCTYYRLAHHTIDTHYTFPISNVNNCSASYLNLVVVSDRNASPVPLRAFVNSLLLYASRPIRLNVVSKVGIPWLEALSSKEFLVYRHDPKELIMRTETLINATGFKSTHYSAAFGVQKLFLPTLTYESGVEKVLVLDDDMVFYTDIAPLVNIVMKDTVLPFDPLRIDKYFRGPNREHNGHDKAYCISGMMGLPLGEETSRLFEEATKNMTREYPNATYKVADQDVVNRYFAENNDGVQRIPCEWSCDVQSCNFKVGRCQNCPSKVCHSMHFTAGWYKTDLDMGKQQWNWDYFDKFDPATVLRFTFRPRLNRTCSHW